jgi:hypothetical protein
VIQAPGIARFLVLLSLLGHHVDTLGSFARLYDDVALVVDHALELLRAHTEQVAYLIRQ